MNPSGSAYGELLTVKCTVTQVWNYSTDGYAEWLGQGHGPADKLAEVQRSHPVSEGTIDVTQLPLSERDASEALALEYTHLLCSRLESDREQYRAEQCALERAERERVQRCADQLQEVRTRKRQVGAARCPCSVFYV